MIDILIICCKFALGCIPRNLIGNQVNIGSGNGLVPFGNKPLADPILTKICNAIW